MKNQMKNVLITGIAALFLFAFTACNSNQSTHTENEHAGSDEHAGHTDAGSAAVNVPNYTTVSQDVKDQIADTYQSYIGLKNALVAASPNEAKQAAGTLKANAGKVASAAVEGDAKKFITDQVSMVSQHAGQIAASSDIEAQRVQLNKLSSSLFSLMKATGANTHDAYYQYCPMANNEKGAYWISENKEIRNPYFGDKMLTCGENKETLAAQ
jgi:Cu(I)/Ag(I) efflux system membrane fusion protein